MSKQSTFGAVVGLALCALASLSPRLASAQSSEPHPSCVPTPRIEQALTPRLMSRFDWLVEEYREQNHVPALSVALNLNGQTLWARGSGILNNEGRAAQADSVYALASISKVVTATLIGRLEEQRRLLDGTPLELVGTEPSGRWTHRVSPRQGPTLRHLMSHTGCIPHYSSVPAVPKTTRHYAHQSHAVRRIARLGTIHGCSIGRTNIYSTAGYTVLGAVLENATWRRFATLLRQEVSQAFGLNSLRVMYESPTLPPNPNRAAWFHYGRRIPFQNNSWKAAGGGLEGNAIDVARFGGLLASGELVSKEFRDRTLLVPQPGSNHGYGWQIGQALDRRLVRHAGASLGSRGELSVWPDDGLSIAILSNARHHHGLKALAEQMAALWFEAVQELAPPQPTNGGATRKTTPAGAASPDTRDQRGLAPCKPADATTLTPDPHEDRGGEGGCKVGTRGASPLLVLLLLGLLRPQTRRP